MAELVTDLNYGFYKRTCCEPAAGLSH